MHRAFVTGIAFVAVLVGISVVPTSTSARPSEPSGGTMCFGAQADILGTPGDDVLEGTPAGTSSPDWAAMTRSPGRGGDTGDDEALGGRGTDDCVAETEVKCERRPARSHACGCSALCSRSTSGASLPSLVEQRVERLQ